MQILFVKNDKVLCIKIENAMQYVSWDHLAAYYTFQSQWISIIYVACEMYIMQFSNST